MPGLTETLRRELGRIDEQIMRVQEQVFLKENLLDELERKKLRYESMLDNEMKYERSHKRGVLIQPEENNMRRRRTDI